jgi:penicillin amidase
MRVVPFVISTVISAGLVFTLNKSWQLDSKRIPPLGKFLSPQQGFWQNAEPANHDFSDDLQLNGIKGKVDVYFDERLVPHVFAENDDDLYFVQGYLHARFRLWQMEFQTMAAAGRLSEVLGGDERLIRFDRETRRMGMVFAAENALRMMESDPVTKSGCDAYTAGVNAYISSLTEATLPLEYKLLDYKPEKWSNFRIALFLKQMSRTLAGKEDDLETTNLATVIPFEELKWLYPQVPDSLVPIVPAGTKFAPPAITPVKPASADSLYFTKKEKLAVAQTEKPHANNGSNNWAVSGAKTRSGAPILCNDPHLELSLPSIWYEMQLTSPSMNAYGVTFPGSPNVIIGFNDSIAFGFTNSQRDVKDYYEITFKDDSKQEYWFNGQWQKTILREEIIKVKSGKTIRDTVAYTLWGPVMYDKSFSTPFSQGRAIACRWSAHDASNDGLMWFYLNRAKNYEDYFNAIQVFDCPGQNIIFASKRGDIALWQQGKFPARWYGQGLMLMPGNDSSYMWQGFIPKNENPHVVNPVSGFIASANQRPVDSTYPYFIPGNYNTARGVIAARKLTAMQQIVPEDMMKLQNDVFDLQASQVMPALLKYTDETKLDTEARKYLEMIRTWDFEAAADSRGETVFRVWMDSLEAEVWNDDLKQVNPPGAMPTEQTLMEAMLRDSAFKYTDNIHTSQRETWYDVVTAALQKAAVRLKQAEDNHKLEWAKFKEPVIYHLLRTSLMPFAYTGLNMGGNGNTLNALTKSHGPSWRMIVHLDVLTEAYGVYPGGQSGNPGSRFYNNFIETWAKGAYYKLWVMRRSDTTDKRVKWKISFANKNS